MIPTKHLKHNEGVWLYPGAHSICFTVKEILRPCAISILFQHYTKELIVQVQTCQNIQTGLNFQFEVWLSAVLFIARYCAVQHLCHISPTLPISTTMSTKNKIPQNLFPSILYIMNKTGCAGCAADTDKMQSAPWDDSTVECILRLSGFYVHSH